MGCSQSSSLSLAKLALVILLRILEMFFFTSILQSRFETGVEGEGANQPNKLRSLEETLARKPTHGAGTCSTREKLGYCPRTILG